MNNDGHAEMHIYYKLKQEKLHFKKKSTLLTKKKTNASRFFIESPKGYKWKRMTETDSCVVHSNRFNR